MQRAIHSDC